MTATALRPVAVVLTAVLLLAACASSPVDRWYKAASTVATLNDTVVDLHELGLLADRDVKAIAPGLKTVNGALDKAKERLPEGGTVFETLLDTVTETHSHLAVELEKRRKLASDRKALNGGGE